MINRKELKPKAKQFAFNNKWNYWRPQLVYLLLSLVLTVIAGIVVYALGYELTDKLEETLTTFIEILLTPMAVGMITYYIKMVRGEYISTKEILFGKYKIFPKIILVQIIVSILTMLGFFLLVIPAFIVAYQMIMTTYILADDISDNMGASEITSYSKKLMDGHKWDYFIFETSFLGWLLLGIITFGIAFIWVAPYMDFATVMYYEELKKISN